MAQPQRIFTLPRRKSTPANPERQGLLESLAATRVLIDHAYRSFNCATDSQLIESYVFEINALQSRYSYLLRRIKELEAPT